MYLAPSLFQALFYMLYLWEFTKTYDIPRNRYSFYHNLTLRKQMHREMK